jgi:hypothetical protein
VFDEIAAMFSRYWKILTLDKEAFMALKESEGSLWFSTRLFVVLALITSLGSLARIGNILEEPTLAERLQQLAADTRVEVARFPPFLSDPLQKVASSMDQVAVNLIELQPPLGNRPSRIIRTVGRWLGIPLELLSGWMVAALAIWLVARLMGGQGTLRQHYSLLLMAFTPQVLRFVQYLPTYLTPPQAIVGLLVLSAWVWSLAIAVNVLALVHELTTLKAALVLSTTFFIFLMAIPEVVVILLGLFGVIFWKLVFP